MREIIRQKFVDSLAMTPLSFTRRDVHLPSVVGKAAGGRAPGGCAHLNR